MEDFKFILYILAAVAFFLYNTWRKAFKGDNEENLPDELPERRPTPREKPNPNQPLPQRPQTAQRPAAPPTSFEDILRELQPKAERAQEQVRPAAEKVKETVREKVKPEPKPIAVQSYERAADKALSLEDPEEAREAYRRAQRRQIATHESFGAYKVADKKAHKYAALLRNPQTVRDAFILTEIFKRKYE